MAETVARLPEAVREALREPLGPVVTDADALLDGAGTPLVAVGDVVTYHLLEVGRPPDVALVDGRTQREATTGAVADRLDALDADYAVANAAGTISAALVEAIADALADGEPSVVAVDGEEDLAALPAVLLAPDGATVVYGQPDEGMVRVDVGPDARERARSLLERFDTEERLWSLLDGGPGSES